MTETIFNFFSAGDSPLPAIDLIIRSSAIIGLAGIIVICLRNASSATRHLIWTASLVAILFLPVFYFVGPTIKLAILPPEVTAPERPTRPLPPASPLEPVDIAVPSLPTTGGAEADTNPATTIPSALNKQSASPAPQEAATSLANPDPTSSDIQPQTALIFLWLFGAIVVGLRLLVAHIGLMLLSRSSSIITDPATNSLIAEIADDLNIRRHVVLKSTLRNVPPLTWGVFRPVVILPMLADLDDEQKLRSVLLHELAHIKRIDWLTQLLGQITCVLYWFNPLTWYAHSRQQIEQEMACDDHVISAGTSPGNYATNLLDILRGSRVEALPAYASTAMARKSSFEGRLVAILDPHRRRNNLGPVRTVATLGLMCAVVLPLIAVHPVPASQSLPADSILPDSILPGPTTVAEIPPGIQSDLPVSSAEEVVGPLASGTPDRQESPLPASEINSSADTEFVDTEAAVDAPARGLEVDDSIVMPADTTKLRAMLVALGDEDAEIRRLAAQILGELGSHEAIGPLTDVAENDPNRSVRVGAIRALGELGSEASLPALIQSLQDAEAEVRWTAAWALGELGIDTAVPALASTLSDEDRNVRVQAARALGELESELALQALITALNDSAPDVRVHAARAIADIGSKEAVPALVAALDDENDDVRLHVVRALGDLEDNSSAVAVLRLRSDPNAEVRAHVALALGEMDADVNDAVPALVMMLDDEDAQVRLHAAQSLGEIEDPATLPAIGKLATSDPSPHVRVVATRALSEFDTPDAVPFLKVALRDSDLNVQRSAARALGEFDDISVAGELIRTLDSEDDELRANSAYSLGELRSEDAVPALLPLLDDESTDVRINAIRALGSIRVDNEVVTARLMQILQNDPDRNVRREAARSLSEM